MPKHTAIRLSVPDYADLIGYLNLMQVFWPRRAEALAAIIRTTPMYSLWRNQVAYCPVCQQFIAIRYRKTVIKEAYFPDHFPNVMPVPASAKEKICKGSNRRARLTPLVGTQDPNIVKVQIEHLVRTFSPDLTGG